MCLDISWGYKHFTIVLCSTYLMLPKTKEQFFEINVQFLLWIRLSGLSMAKSRKNIDYSEKPKLIFFGKRPF